MQTNPVPIEPVLRSKVHFDGAPQQMIYDPVAHRLWLVSTTGPRSVGYLNAFDFTTDALTSPFAPVPTRNDPWGLALEDGTLGVGHFGSPEFSTYDASNAKLRRIAPLGQGMVRIVGWKGTFIAPLYGRSGTAIIPTKKGANPQFTLGESGPSDCAAAPSWNSVVVCYLDPPCLGYLVPDTGAFVKVAGADAEYGSPVSVAFDSNVGLVVAAYVKQDADEPSPAMLFGFDRRGKVVYGPTPVGDMIAGGKLISRPGGGVLAVCATDSLVYAVDTHDDVASSWQVEGESWSAAIAPNGTTLFLASNWGNTVCVYDLAQPVAVA